MRDRLYVHIVWTTRDRTHVLNRSAADFLVEFLPVVARQERANILAVGIVQDHLHLIVRLHQTTAILRLLQRLKGGSSVLLNKRISNTRSVRWARGYNLESVSPSSVAYAIAYVETQSARHPHLAISDWTSPSLQ